MEQVISYLKKHFGYDSPDPEFYRHIREWQAWYDGSETAFHRTLVNNGLTVAEHTLGRMNMAKKVAEDWANLLLNEKTGLTVSDPDSAEFLMGADGTGGVFGENDVWTQLNQLVEKVFALGTGAVVAWLDRASFSTDGTVLHSPQAKIRLDYVTAQNILPLSWRGGQITEAAFACSLTENGVPVTYLQVHRLEEDGYVIHSRYFSEQTGKELPLPPGISPVVRTKCGIPWFVILKPNLVNNLSPGSPMGISVYANSIDILKGLDLCYDSLRMEFWLGRKMVFLRRDLMTRDQDGRLYAPQDCGRQLFMYLGDKHVDGDLLPQEFNPALRVQDHADAIRQHLNYLACKCGLGDRFYRLDAAGTGQPPSTATEIVSENSTLFRSLKKHEILLERPLTGLCRAILWIGKHCLGQALDPDCSILVRFDDSIIEDRASEQKRDMELVQMKLMLPWEFRMKYFAETEAAARKACEEAEQKGEDHGT